MAEIVNLRRAKKQRGRDAASALAQQNRVRYGRTKQQQENDRREAERRAALLDGKRRDPPA